MQPNPAALSTALAQPTNVVFDPSGNFMYVAAFGTDRVARVDTAGKVPSFVEVSLPSGSGANADPRNKRGPRGLALNASTRTLYALNSISNTLSVIDTATGTVTTEVPVGTDPTPASIKAGRGFLYDAKLSGNGTGSCASCHVDGDMDATGWNLGDPTGPMTTVVQNGETIQLHPLKGPMATQTLRGLANLAALHRRGDKPDFQSFNGAFDSLMGGTPLSSEDMDLYAGFANSILFLPNPNQNLDRTLPTSLSGGNAVEGFKNFTTLKLTGFQSQTCNDCHTANPGPGSNALINTGGFSQPLKSPRLRNTYQKRKPDMASYVLAIDTGTAPAVGYTRTLTASNVDNTRVQADWTTLQSQAAIGKYLADNGVRYTQAPLQPLIKAGDTLSVMGVCPGTVATSLRPSGSSVRRR